jgi:hypothetical protein
VKPCCFLFVLISIKGDLPSPVSDYTTAIFKNCYQHLVWINADTTLSMLRLIQCDSFTVTEVQLPVRRR